MAVPRRRVAKSFNQYMSLAYSKYMRLGPILIVALSLTGCSRADDPLPSPAVPTTIAVSPSPHETEEIVIPDKVGTKPVFVETIDERTKTAGIKALRSYAIEKDDVEIRVWAGFGLTTSEGYVFKRQKGEWSALKLSSRYIDHKLIDLTTPLGQPLHGWDALWQSLRVHRILTLPDAELIDCNGHMEDGFSFVVEARRGQDYRTYMYENADGRCVEAGEMSQIYRTIQDEFDLGVRK